jgi:hypothetical protein
MSIFAENIGTIITGLALLWIVAGIVWKLIHDKKKGASVCHSCACGGNCCLSNTQDK